MLPSRGVIRTVPSPGIACALRLPRQHPANCRELQSFGRSFGSSSRLSHSISLRRGSPSLDGLVRLPSGLALGSRTGGPMVAGFAVPLSGHQQLRNASWWNPLGYVSNPLASTPKPSPLPANPSASTPATATPPSTETASVSAATNTTSPSATASTTTAATDATEAVAKKTPPLTDEAAAEVAKLSEIFSNPDAATEFDYESFQETLLNLPEDIGFLRSLGLDYGWGPSSMVQWFIEHVHVWSGMPWWGTLAACAVILRVAFFKVNMDAMEASGKLGKLMAHPKFKALTAAHIAATAKNDLTTSAEIRRELSVMKKLSGFSIKPMAINFLNIPLGFGFFRVIRGMTDVPVPSLETGGLWWFADMTVSDPYWLLPIFSVVGMVALMRSTPPTSPQAVKTQKLMLLVLVPVFGFVSISLPAAMQWFFCCTGIVSILQNYLRKQPWFREALGYPSKPPAPPTGDPSAALKDMFATAAGVKSPSDVTAVVDKGYQPPSLAATATASNPAVLPAKNSSGVAGAQDILKSEGAQEILKTMAATPAAPKANASILDKVGLGDTAREVKDSLKAPFEMARDKMQENSKPKKDTKTWEQKRAESDEAARLKRIQEKRFKKQQRQRS